MNVNRITQQIIGAAIEVHRHLGPGLLEKAYDSTLTLSSTAWQKLRDSYMVNGRPLYVQLKGLASIRLK